MKEGNNQRLKKCQNSLIMFDVPPVQQVFAAGRVIPIVLDDSHVVDPLPAALPLRAGGDEEQQTSRKQPQSPCHFSQGRSVTRRSGESVVRVLVSRATSGEPRSVTSSMQAVCQLCAFLGGLGSVYETLREQNSRSIEPRSESRCDRLLWYLKRTDNNRSVPAR